ncbi:MAG: rod shape-determining protein [Paludibacteraceae bacterium]|nr:rod shape-determining protein [Paludibacteraceae bacterium]
MAKKRQILQSVPLVAVDLGSHGVRAMAAEMTTGGLLRILGVETSNKFECVERGIVTNTSDAGFMINEVLKKLSNRVRVEALPSAFVCVGGRTMQVVAVHSTRDQVRRKEIAQPLLDAMEVECKQKIEARNPDVAVLDLVPYFYKLDGVEQEHQPTENQRAALVEAHFIAFVGKKELEQKIVDSFNRSAKRLEHIYVRPDALMNAITTDEDMANGCAILDMGAQTTTLTVYKGNQYLYNKVVPLGGYDITRDIEQIGISLAYAEQLKCKYGYASADMVPTNHRFRLPAPTMPQGEVAVMATEIADIISARLEQMLTPLLDVLNAEASRFRVLYVTGGAAMLQGLVEYIQAKTSIPVMYGSHASWLTTDTPDEMCMPTYSSLVGTLLLGADYRNKHPEVTTSGEGILDIIKEKTLTIFTDQTGY